MKYDFNKIIERKGKDALAYDGIGSNIWGFAPEKAKPGFDEIPMWVADMNFETCPSITKALEERIRHPLYGYYLPSDQYYESILEWQRTRHGFKGLTKDMVGYENGVHGCIVSCIRALSQPGDAILLHSPAYVGFFGDLKDTGRKPVLSPLSRDAEGVWRMDYEDMDRKIKKNHIRLAIFCSPHNPTGRVWEKEELEKAMEVFQENDVIVISDEIWSDIIYSGHKHIPTCLVNEDAAKRTVGIYAPSKTFNLAGLIGSYHIIMDPMLRNIVTKSGDSTRYNEMNVLSMHALVGAYSKEGQEWTAQLCQYLERNCRYTYELIRDHLDGVSAAMPEGTYMVFMDCREYLKKHPEKTLDGLLKAGWDVGVAYQDGRKFADSCSIRLNVALPMSRLQEAMGRMEKYVFTK